MNGSPIIRFPVCLRFFSLMVLCVFWLLVGCAQVENTSYPVNNGYTLESAFKKLSKRHPETQWPAPVSGVKVWQGQVYKKLGSRWLKADVYASDAQEGLKPGIILVHGGGWMTGDRTMWAPLAERLAKKGYVAVTVSYRLSPEAAYPAAIHDVRDAIRWLRANAKKYGVNSENIVIAGGSAGGQIAGLIGLTTGDNVLDQYASNHPEKGRVSAIVDIDGLMSFVVPMALKFENDPRKKPSAAGAWFGGRYQDVPELWEQASPLNHISLTTPPMLFIKSGQPRFLAGIEEIEAKLRELSIVYKIEAFPSAPHSFWLFEPWLSPTVDHIDDFLDVIDVKQSANQ